MSYYIRTIWEIVIAYYTYAVYHYKLQIRVIRIRFWIYYFQIGILFLNKNIDLKHNFSAHHTNPIKQRKMHKKPTATTRLKLRQIFFLLYKFTDNVPDIVLRHMSGMPTLGSTTRYHSSAFETRYWSGGIIKPPGRSNVLDKNEMPTVR